jgi:hypothetical protein
MTSGAAPLTADVVDALARLTPQHIAELRASGLSDSTIAASGVYSEHDPTKLGRLLNRRYSKTCGAGLCCPTGLPNLIYIPPGTVAHLQASRVSPVLEEP